jgi:citrate synthase
MGEQLIGSSEAAQILGISRQSLYAYVSRGLLASEPGPGPSRARRYRRDVVERLARERGRRARSEAGAREALSWGLPVVDSALTLIDDGRLMYRGVDVVALSRDATFEQVTALLWTGGVEAAERLFADHGPSRGRRPVADTGEALAGALVRMGASTALTVGSPREAVLRHAARVVGELFAVAGARGEGGLARRLATGWGTLCADDLDAALVLCADHELNVSAFTARCVASADARVEHVLLAALAALHGRRHGGSHVRIAALLDAADREGAAVAIDAALGGGGDLPGFGHPLYPQGDPRARVLLARAYGRRGPSGATGRLIRRAEQDLGLRPNLDLGLVCLVRARGLPDAAAFTLFALGRSAGWVAHALEAWDDGRLIRPRARYVGPAPGAAEVTRD